MRTPIGARISVLLNPDNKIARPWQPKVTKEILDLVKSGTKRIILNAPTGSGKTKIALDLIRSVYRQKEMDSYVAVRTTNEMMPYDETVSKFQMGLIYRYMVGKRRGCAYYTEGDDANTPLCDACLGKQTVVEEYLDERGEERTRKVKVINEEIARRVVRADAVFKDAKNGLSYLEEKYVKDQNAQICLYHSLKQIPSDFVLMTYPYLLNKEIRSGTRLDFSKSLLVVDEAHNLEDLAGFTHHLSSIGIEKAEREFLSSCLPKLEGDFIKNLGVALQRLSSFVNKFSGAHSATPGSELKAFDEEDVKQSQQFKAKHLNKNEFLSKLDDDLKEHYEVIYDAYKQVEEAKQNLAKEKKRETLRNPFFSIANFVEKLKKDQDDYELFSEGSGNLAIKLVDPAPSLQILKEPDILVLMSGTMPSSAYVEKVWGVDGCKEISVQSKYGEDYYSVFRRDSLEFKLIHDQQVSTGWGNRRSAGEKLWQEYSKIIDRAFDEESKFSVLVCCPSYHVARKISYYVTVPKFVEDRHTSIQEVKKLITAGGRRAIVAVAHGKLLEGVEFVQDNKSMIDCVIVAGIPYPVPDDLYKLRLEKVTRRLGIEDGTPEIGQFEREYFRHQPALMAVKQAIGRAVRYPEDRAKVILADDRFKSPRWHSDLMEDKDNKHLQIR